MERQFSTVMTYAVALPAVGCQADLTGFYTFAFAASQPTSSTFVIEATPVGAQETDTKCDVLSINHLGVKTESGTGTVTECWR
jgi:type IV pilus assembly protein PilE